MNAFNIIVTHSLSDGGVAENLNETASVTRGMVRERAVELAVISGRKPHEASKFDWENAKREMIGLPET